MFLGESQRKQGRLSTLQFESEIKFTAIFSKLWAGSKTGGGGMGGLGKNFFSPNLWRYNFFPDIQWCKIFFSALYAMINIFF